MTPDNWRKELLGLAKNYCDSHGITLGTLGGRIVNDGDFFYKLEDGSGCGTDNYFKVLHWFKVNKPRRQRKKVTQHTGGP